MLLPAYGDAGGVCHAVQSGAYVCAFHGSGAGGALRISGDVPAVLSVQPQGFHRGGSHAAAVRHEDPLCSSHCRGAAVRALLRSVCGLWSGGLLLAGGSGRRLPQHQDHGGG